MIVNVTLFVLRKLHRVPLISAPVKHFVLNVPQIKVKRHVLFKAMLNGAEYVMIIVETIVLMCISSVAVTSTEYSMLSSHPHPFPFKAPMRAA